jgi:spore coat protein U-like protein
VTSGATDPKQRKMQSGANNITYGIYRSSGTTQPWGSTTGVNAVTGTGSGSTQNFTGFGVVAVQTTPPPSTYSGTVIATMTY